MNGFFVLAEFSLVKVRKTRLAELAENGSGRAGVALNVISSLDAYLSACQLGITLASLGLGWLGEPAVAILLEPLFSRIAGWSPVYTESVSIAIAFIIITFLHIVFGELIPKSLAIQKAETAAIGTAGLLRLFYKLFYPVIRLLNWLSISALNVIGIHPANEADLAHTEEELRMLVGASEKHGYLDKMESKLLDNVFEFSDRVAEEVMVPRRDMVCIYLQDSHDEVLATVKKYGHTRYPLCDGDKDNVAGLIHIKDLLDYESSNESEFNNIAELKHDILVVPEGMPISLLVQKMRSERTHMAVVADEFGGTAGIVTIEDLLEELVGEIYDEFDIERPEINKLNDNEFEVNGRVLLEEVEDLLNLDFEEESVSTIGGYIFTRLGRKPQKKDQVHYKGYSFEAEEVSGYRISKVKIKKEEQETQAKIKTPE